MMIVIRRGLIGQGIVAVAIILAAFLIRDSLQTATLPSVEDPETVPIAGLEPDVDPTVQEEDMEVTMEVSVGVEEAITTLVAILTMALGPRPLKKIYDAIGLSSGATRVFATYVASVVVGVGALIIGGSLAGIAFSVEGALAVAGAASAASGAAFQRLKDKGSLDD